MSNRARGAFVVLAVTVAIAVGSSTVQAKSCAATYTARRGDSWWSIARNSHTTLKKILKLNGAAMSTMILVGRAVCVPSVAKPAVPVPSAAKPAVPIKAYTRNEIETIIRDIWPDDLENQALKIAWRESNLRPEVINRRTRCCYGLFQICYRWHTGWLPSVGVTSAEQLFDPVLNTLAAYKLYQRNGWGPWKLTS